MSEQAKYFLTKYDKFAKCVATGNKKQFENIATIYAVNEVLEALIRLIETNHLEEIDKTIIYNTLLVSKMYAEKIVEPEAFTPKKWPIIYMKDYLEKIEELGINPENFKNKR